MAEIVVFQGVVVSGGFFKNCFRYGVKIGHKFRRDVDVELQVANFVDVAFLTSKDSRVRK